MRLSTVRSAAFALAFVSAAACGKKNANQEPLPELDPVTVHVRNENFLDMNVSLAGSGVSRRLGTVSGNSTGSFTVAWNMTNGSPFAITATPIGGRGQATTGTLNVSPGQVIEFRVATVLRQSVVSVHDP
jgi:hypothetical protein